MQAFTYNDNLFRVLRDESGVLWVLGSDVFNAMEPTAPLPENWRVQYERDVLFWQTEDQGPSRLYLKHSTACRMVPKKGDDMGFILNFARVSSAQMVDYDTKKVHEPVAFVLSALKCADRWRVPLAEILDTACRTILVELEGFEPPPNHTLCVWAALIAQYTDEHFPSLANIPKEIVSYMR